MSTLRRLLRPALGALAAVIATAAAAADPEPLGTFGDWRAYKLEEATRTICYALSEPADSEPKTVRRGPIYVMVTNWPNRGVRGEVSVVAGYPYQDGGQVTANVDGTRFALFTQNDARDEGGAWLADRGEETRMIAAMKRGNSLIVTGTSRRGTLTTDRYSLAGVTAAIDAIDGACN